MLPVAGCRLLDVQASVEVSLDPVDRAMRVRAAVVFPGPEWRTDVYNEDTGLLELVQVTAVLGFKVET